MTHAHHPSDVRPPSRPQQAAELLESGCTRDDIRLRVRRGELARLRRGSYFVGEVGPLPEDRHRLLVQAVAAQRPDAVVSHASAAVLHGLPVPASTLRRAQLVVECRHTGTDSGQSYVVRRRREIGETSNIDGLPVTSLPQTVLDMCRILPISDAVAVADAGLRNGANRTELLEMIARSKSRQGNPVARQAVLFADGRSESAGESWSRWTMHQLGLPAPVLQQEFDLGTCRARSDFWWPDELVVGEFDGMVKYGRLLQPGQTVQDVVMAEKEREVAFRRRGIWVVRWSAKDLSNRTLFRTMILDALDRQAA